MLAKQHPAYGGAAVGGGEDLAVRDQSAATKWLARELGLDEADLRKNCQLLRRMFNGLYLPRILIGLSVHASHDLVDSVGLIIVFEIVYFLKFYPDRPGHIYSWSQEERQWWWERG